jgi:hypothetical protein
MRVRDLLMQVLRLVDKQVPPEQISSLLHVIIQTCVNDSMRGAAFVRAFPP